MSKSRQIFRNTVALTASRLADRASAICLVFFISHTLHASGLGIYVTAITYWNLASALAEIGLADFLVREIAKDRSRASYYIIHLSVIGIMAGVVTVGVFSVIIS